MADLLITATLDSTDVEKKAKQIESALADSKMNNPVAGQALAKNMDAAKTSTDAMFKVLGNMSGPAGRLSRQFKTILDATRMMKPVLEQMGNASIIGAAGRAGAAAAAGRAAGEVAGGAGGRVATTALGTGIGISGAKGLGKIGKITEAYGKSVLQKFKDEFKNGPPATGPVKDVSFEEIRKFRQSRKRDSQELLGLQAVKADLSRFKARFKSRFSRFKTALNAPIRKIVNDLKTFNSFTVTSSSRLAAFSKGLGQATLVVAAFVASLKAGGAIFNAFTGRKRIEGEAKTYGEFADWLKANTEERIMSKGTVEMKNRFLNKKLSESQSAISTYNEYQATLEAGAGTRPKAYNAKIKQLRENMVSKGAASTKDEDINAFYFKSMQDIITTRQALSDLKEKPDKIKTGSATSYITDDITRIGGSIGGGMDMQRSMANDLTSIKDLVSSIKSSVSNKPAITPFV